jgi:hypothetical protein
MTRPDTFFMHTESPIAPDRAPYFGGWPIATVTTEFGTASFEFAWSTFDVWPELLLGIQAAQARRQMRRYRA